MRHWPHTTTLCAALIASASLQAQEDPETQAPDVVVVGDPDLEKRTGAFVNALMPHRPGVQQIARFEKRICPAAVGVTSTQKLLINKRIREIVARAGIRVAAAKCQPNLIVIVTDDKRKLTRALANRHAAYLSGLSDRDVERLREAPGGAIAWRIAGAPLTADGAPVYGLNRTTRQASRITMPTRPQVAAGVIAIETESIYGLSTQQIADYAVMRTLLGSDPTALSATDVPTILKLFDTPASRAAPSGVTHWDIAALRAAYASRTDLRAPAQRSEVRRQLTRALGASTIGP
jgi:hypothetical protein